MSNIFAITGGEIIDSRPRRRADVLIVEGKIQEVSDKLDIPTSAHIIDATDLIVSPGLVDIQVHLREPGFEEAEDIVSGTRASVLGGMTAVQCMPNTIPCIDNADVYMDVKRRASNGLCDVFVSAAITKGRNSQEVVNFAELYEVGARVFTDDGDCVKTAQLMRQAIETLSTLPGCVLAQHCEDFSLVDGGVIDEGDISKQLGLDGRHRVAEEIIIARDIALMKSFGRDLRYHVLHLSTFEGLQTVRAGQNAGINVSCEVAPQHLALTSEKLLSGNANFKMNPPLRTRRDNLALCQGIADGTIAAIATDHAPHPKSKKECSIEKASPGMLGVQTALAASITTLVETSIITLEELIGVMSIKPAKIINANNLENGGHGLDVAEGNPANITVFNPKEKWIVNAAELQSKSENSPWDAMELTGKVYYTFVKGMMMCEKGQPTK